MGSAGAGRYNGPHESADSRDGVLLPGLSWRIRAPLPARGRARLSALRSLRGDLPAPGPTAGGGCRVRRIPPPPQRPRRPRLPPLPRAPGRSAARPPRARGAGAGLRLRPGTGAGRDAARGRPSDAGVGSLLRPRSRRTRAPLRLRHLHRGGGALPRPRGRVRPPRRPVAPGRLARHHHLPADRGRALRRLALPARPHPRGVLPRGHLPGDRRPLRLALRAAGKGRGADAQARAAGGRSDCRFFPSPNPDRESP